MTTNTQMTHSSRVANEPIAKNTPSGILMTTFNRSQALGSMTENSQPSGSRGSQMPMKEKLLHQFEQGLLDQHNSAKAASRSTTAIRNTTQLQHHNPYGRSAVAPVSFCQATSNNTLISNNSTMINNLTSNQTANDNSQETGPSPLVNRQRSELYQKNTERRKAFFKNLRGVNATTQQMVDSQAQQADGKNYFQMMQE